jgi:hypothetical protein
MKGKPANIKRKRAKSKPRPSERKECLIDKLPPEILSRIFEVGTIDDMQRREEIVMDRDISDEESDLEDDPLNVEIPMFPIRISHVCRRWRETAVKTPSLWTKIRLSDNPKSLVRSAVWLTRSREHPVDVSIEFVLPDEILFWSKREISNSAVYKAAERDLQRALGVIIPHSHRCRSFELCLSLPDHMDLALSFLETVPGAPFLERISLTCDDFNSRDQVEDSEGSEIEDSAAPRLIFSGNTPKLLSVNLRSVAIDWNLLLFEPVQSSVKLGGTPSRLSTLRTLSILDPTIRPWPDVVEFTNVLQCCTRLSSLDLQNVSLKSGALPEGEVRVLLPYLTELALASDNSIDATNILSCIYAPELTDFSFRMEDDDCSLFIQELVAPRGVRLIAPSQDSTYSAMTDPSKSMLTNVESLDINSASSSIDTMNALAEMCTNVENLVLFNERETPSTAFEALLGNVRRAAGQHTSSSPSDASRPSVWCPRLKKLEIWDRMYEMDDYIAEFVEKRLLVGLPITELAVSSGIWLPEKSIKLIQRSVERFRIIDDDDSDMEDILYDDEGVEFGPFGDEPEVFALDTNENVG